MTTVTLLVWVCAFVSFGWGVFRFFRRPSGPTWPTTLVARLGMAVGACHAAAIAMSAAGPLPQGIGAALIAAALALFWSAIRACGGRRLTAIFEKDQPHFLVRSGPYRYIRHPFYASYTLFWFAGAIASGSLLALVTAVLMWAIYADAIQREERKFAQSPLAAEYDAYRRRTGRMVPRLGMLLATLREKLRRLFSKCHA